MSNTSLMGLVGLSGASAMMVSVSLFFGTVVRTTPERALLHIGIATPLLFALIYFVASQFAQNCIHIQRAVATEVQGYVLETESSNHASASGAAAGAAPSA